MFPTPWTVQHLAYVSATEDSHGNPVPSYAAPVDRKVYGWASPATRTSAEPKTAGVESVIVILELFAPTFPVNARDRIAVPGYPEPFEVIGDPEDYGHGPFNFTPGMVVNLTKGR